MDKFTFSAFIAFLLAAVSSSALFALWVPKEALRSLFVLSWISGFCAMLYVLRNES